MHLMDEIGQKETEKRDCRKRNSQPDHTGYERQDK